MRRNNATRDLPTPPREDEVEDDNLTATNFTDVDEGRVIETPERAPSRGAGGVAADSGSTSDAEGTGVLVNRTRRI